MSYPAGGDGHSLSPDPDVLTGSSLRAAHSVWDSASCRPCRLSGVGWCPPLLARSPRDPTTKELCVPVTLTRPHWARQNRQRDWRHGGARSCAKRSSPGWSGQVRRSSGPGSGRAHAETTLRTVPAPEADTATDEAAGTLTEPRATSTQPIVVRLGSWPTDRAKM